MRSGASQELLQGLFVFLVAFIYENKAGNNNKQKVKSVKGFISVLMMDNGYSLEKIYL